MVSVGETYQVEQKDEGTSQILLADEIRIEKEISEDTFLINKIRNDKKIAEHAETSKGVLVALVASGYLKKE